MREPIEATPGRPYEPKKVAVEQLNAAIDQLKRTNELLRQVIQDQQKDINAMKVDKRRLIVISAMYTAAIAVAILFDLTLFTW